MDAKELMIGDWVHVEAHRGFNAQNVRVETIPDNDSDNEYGHHYGHIATWLEGGDNDFRDVEAKHLQPIPLTEEILNKNGFYFYHINELCSNSNYFNEDEELKLELSLGRSGKIFWTVNATEYILMSLDYVHQLQHALRLCGIDKEIVI